jgi:hypothetical protein
MRGNERAARLTWQALMESGRSMDWSDILNDIREASRTKDSSTNKKSMTMTRLHEHQVK